jgi:PAS domain S-box-containing protein
MVRNAPASREELAPLFRALGDSPDPVFVTDRANRIVFWNVAARQFLGFEVEEAMGADCSDLLHGSDRFGNRYCSEHCPIKQMANRGEIVHEFDLTLLTKDHQAIDGNVSVLQLRAGGADQFFLLHLLRGKERHQAGPPIETSGPPRPRLVVARESEDVRARKLTGREIEVLGMLAAGRSTPEIAERLHISQLTARSHIQNILEKLEVHSKAEAVAFAFQKNLT